MCLPGLALQLEVNLPFLLCFTLYLRAIFQLQAPRGLYFEGRFNGGFFTLPVWGGLYLEGLIHGGAYFRNFRVPSIKRFNTPINVMPAGGEAGHRVGI